MRRGLVHCTHVAIRATGLKRHTTVQVVYGLLGATVLVLLRLFHCAFIADTTLADNRVELFGLLVRGKAHKIR